MFGFDPQSLRQRQRTLALQNTTQKALRKVQRLRRVFLRAVGFNECFESFHINHMPYRYNTVKAFYAVMVLFRFNAPWHNSGMRKHYFKEWRKHRGLTQARVADRLEMAQGAYSRIERGDRPYNQPFLEALADALMCEPADLLMRNPADAESIWSIIDQVPVTERPTLINVIRAFVVDRKAG